MNAQNFITFLENPKDIQQESTRDLKSIVDEYPYFQPARALYLKTLKNIESFKYNNELKITAAHTTDRTVLFDFITSKTFNKVESSSEEKEAKTNDINIGNSSQSEVTKAKKDLQVGKPLAFNKHETLSFNQWLQLSSKTPIPRKKLDDKQNNSSKNLQENIIDQFIAKNPKIPKISKTSSTVFLAEKPKKSNELMTETLAKVYLEQNKYDNAIKAYEILSLKYPEKSGFFADQIKRIRILKNSK